jgi:hypothetical protein
MKAVLSALLLLAPLPLLCSAQEQQKKPAQNVKVETVQEHKGASHYHQHSVVPAEHHTVTRWHYHRSYRRASQTTVPAGGNKDAQKEKDNRKPTDK